MNETSIVGSKGCFETNLVPIDLALEIFHVLGPLLLPRLRDRREERKGEERRGKERRGEERRGEEREKREKRERKGGEKKQSFFLFQE